MLIIEERTYGRGGETAMEDAADSGRNPASRP